MAEEKPEPKENGIVEIGRRKYEIRPTGAQVSDQYSDISMTNLVNIISDQVSSERQTIWQRYTAYLVANSITIGFLVSQARTGIEILAGGIFGIVLCIFWYIITVSGWKLHVDRRDHALRFYWTILGKKANPFHEDAKYETRLEKGPIFLIAILTIWLFILWYMFIGIYYGIFK